MLKAIFIFFFRQSDVFFHVNNEWPKARYKKNWVHDGSTFGSERKHLDRKIGVSSLGLLFLRLFLKKKNTLKQSTSKGNKKKGLRIPVLVSGVPSGLGCAKAWFPSRFDVRQRSLPLWRLSEWITTSRRVQRQLRNQAATRFLWRRCRPRHLPKCSKAS